MPPDGGSPSRSPWRPSRRPQPLILWVAAATLLVAAGWGLTPASSPWRFVVIAAGMGILNTLFLAEGRARIAVTYATGTLVSLGVGLADAITRHAPATAWLRPLLLWAALTVGAAVGAVAVLALNDVATLLAVGALAALAVVSSRALRP